MPQVTLDTDTITDYEIEGETGRVFVITRTRYLDGDTVVSEQRHRRPIEPDADISNEPAEAKAIAAEVRKPERLARFEAIKEVEARAFV